MKSNHLKSYKAIIERSKDAYWAFIPELEGVSGVGETVQEAKQSMLEGLSLQQELGNLSNQAY
ncbi:MAG: type II toxin-antitoxin system HicB family antitoxin, partial [Crocinitomicaceae bacterium]|nr:type II toxin-antitoxin system HicB family antitoxin [Crocinitomicaceae bacterium]